MDICIFRKLINLYCSGYMTTILVFYHFAGCYFVCSELIQDNIKHVCLFWTDTRSGKGHMGQCAQELTKARQGQWSHALPVTSVPGQWSNTVYAISGLSVMENVNCFKKVSEAKPYGDIDIVKIDCICHVQKQIWGEREAGWWTNWKTTTILWQCK